MGRLLMGYVCVLLFATGIFNFREVLDWREPLSGRVAAEVVRRLDGRRWVVTDGSSDVMIRLHGYMAGKFVGVLNDEGPGGMMDARIQRMILKDPVFSRVDGDLLQKTLSGTNAVTFAQGLMQLAPGVEDSVWVMNGPGIWDDAQRQAIPDVVGYRGVADQSTVDWDELLRVHFEFWDEVERLPALGQYTPVWLRGHRARVRLQIYEVGARLADEFAQAGRMADAKTVLERATRIKEEPVLSTLDTFY